MDLGFGVGHSGGVPPPIWLRCLPNALSLLRLALAGLFPWLPREARIPVAAAAAASDWLDGAAARRLRATSLAGGLLDALADKLFVGIVLLTFGFEEAMALWLVGLVLFRDLVVAFLVGCIVARRQWLAFTRMPPHPLGKATTTFQFALIAALLLHPPLAPWMAGPAAVLSPAAGFVYLRRYLRGPGAPHVPAGVA